MVNYVRGLEWASDLAVGLGGHFDILLSASIVKPIAPFQFVLPILEALYNGFEPDRPKREITDLWNYETQRPKWHTNDPEDYQKAHEEAAVRAIAFFSWEETSRVFLLRRVYPTYFGFLSYSQCPEQWGAVGIMLNELRQEGSGYFDGPWEQGRVPFCTQVGQFSQHALPFLVEVQRLNFQAITLFPVVQDAEIFEGTKQLLGVFVVLLKNAEVLPFNAIPANDGDRDSFRGALQQLGKIVTTLLDKQLRLFHAAHQESPDLPELWLKRAKDHTDVRVLQLDFYPEHETHKKERAETSRLISLLNRAGFCCASYAPPRPERSGAITILVAPPPPISLAEPGSAVDETVQAVAKHSVQEHFSVRVFRVRPTDDAEQASRVILGSDDPASQSIQGI